jgi:hypothetical protein
MMFDLLNFQPHLNGISGAIAARHKFENDWEISVVAGPGLYGKVEDETFEVGIFRPNGNMTEDVSGWNTKEEVSAMMWVLSQL